jgi:hypothetical protein
MSDQPIIELEHRRVMCGLHGEPLRAQWPLGYAIFTLKAFETVCSAEGWAEEMKSAYQAGAQTDKEAVERLLDRRPLCCRMTADDLHSLYVETGIGRLATCQGCFATSLGTEYRTVRKTFRHLCFNCAIHRIHVKGMN